MCHYKVIRTVGTRTFHCECGAALRQIDHGSCARISPSPTLRSTRSRPRGAATCTHSFVLGALPVGQVGVAPLAVGNRKPRRCKKGRFTHAGRRIERLLWLPTTSPPLRESRSRCARGFAAPEWVPHRRRRDGAVLGQRGGERPEVATSATLRATAPTLLECFR